MHAAFWPSRRAKAPHQQTPCNWVKKGGRVPVRACHSCTQRGSGSPHGLGSRSISTATRLTRGGACTAWWDTHSTAGRAQASQTMLRTARCIPKVQTASGKRQIVRRKLQRGKSEWEQKVRSNKPLGTRTAEKVGVQDPLWSRSQRHFLLLVRMCDHKLATKSLHGPPQAFSGLLRGRFCKGAI